MAVSQNIPLQAMTAAERRAVITACVLFVGGILTAPHILCWASGRAPASSFGELVRDALVVEVLGMAALLLWPLKTWLKRWIHAPPAGSTSTNRMLRWATAGLWVVVLLGLTAALVPQGFFVMTGRAKAGNGAEWAIDMAAFLLAVVPQVIALLPWAWAARRLEQRIATKSTD